jgi:hypothetical protein
MLVKLFIYLFIYLKSSHKSNKKQVGVARVIPFAPMRAKFAILLEDYRITFSFFF